MKTRKAFTLVEMLVVIMIIALLAAALFPAISSAIDAARATAAKNKGRGIWASLVSANAEREPLGMALLWPRNVGIASNGCTLTSTLYFQYLMSDGVEPITAPTPVDDSDKRLVSDLKPDILFVAGGGLSSAGAPTKFGAAHNAWSVFGVDDSSDAGAPLFITKNVLFSGKSSGDLVSTNSGCVPTLDKTALNMRRGVWVAKGGGTFDARERYLVNPSQPILPGTNEYCWVTPGTTTPASP